MEASKPFYIAGGNIKRSVTMENSLTAPQKVNTILWPRSYNSGYIFKRTEEKCFLVLQSTHTYTHTHTYIYSINNSQNRKAVQISINVWMDKQIAMYTCNRILCSYKKEWSTEIHFNMEELWNP